MITLLGPLSLEVDVLACLVSIFNVEEVFTLLWFQPGDALAICGPVGAAAKVGRVGVQVDGRARVLGHGDHERRQGRENGLEERQHDVEVWRPRGGGGALVCAEDAEHCAANAERRGLAAEAELAAETTDVA